MEKYKENSKKEKRVSIIWGTGSSDDFKHMMKYEFLSSSVPAASNSYPTAFSQPCKVVVPSGHILSRKGQLLFNQQVEDKRKVGSNLSTRVAHR